MGTLADLCASEIVKKELDKAYDDGYNKAIDEFAEEIYKNLTHYVDKDGSCEGIIHYEEVYGIAERLKKGGAV